MQAKQIAAPGSSIFKAYDIRGIVDRTLTTSAVRAIGSALGSLASEAAVASMVVGRDGRLSGPTLRDALIDGITSTGIDVIDIGMVPTPVLYFATHHLKTGSGVSITGSHNPPEYNGSEDDDGGCDAAWRRHSGAAAAARARAHRDCASARDRAAASTLYRRISMRSLLTSSWHGR